MPSSIWQWLRQEGPTAVKHHGLLHPWTTFFLHYAVVTTVTLAANEVLSSSLSSMSMEDHGNDHRHVHNTDNASHKQRIAVAVWCYSLFLVLFRYFVVAKHESRGRETNTCIKNRKSGMDKEERHQEQRNQCSAQSAVLYRATFLCNITLTLGPLGVWMASTNKHNGARDDTYHWQRITQAHCIAIGIDQLLWGLDLFLGGILYLLRLVISSQSSSSPQKAPKTPIGLATYIFRATSWVELVTPWHHLWCIPVLLYGIDWQFPTGSSTNNANDMSPYWLSLVVILVNVAMSRWLTPKTVQFPVVGRVSNMKKDRPSGSGHNGNEALAATTTTTTEMKTIYCNVNLAHELWDDVKIPILQVVNQYKHQAIPYMLALWWRWAFFNWLVFLVLRQACSWMRRLSLPHGAT